MLACAAVIMSFINKVYLQWRRLTVLKKILFINASVLLLYILLQCWSYLQVKDNKGAVRCQHSETETRNLLELAAGVNRTLYGMKLTYFLCYGALWAAVDKEKIYPWQDKLEFCAMNEEVSKLDELFFKHQFDSYDLDISYVDRHGYYLVRDKSRKTNVEAQVILFERFTEKSLSLDEMRRIGWENRIMPAIKGFDTMDTFPLWIIDKPLNVVKLNGLLFPAPKGSIEINKYLQPDTWWKDQTPLKCRMRKQ